MTDPFPPGAGPNYTAQYSPSPTYTKTYTKSPSASPSPTTTPGTPGQQSVPVPTTTPVVTTTPPTLPVTGPNVSSWLAWGCILILIGILVIVVLKHRNSQ